MKKLLLLSFSIALIQLKAQCPVTVNGFPTGHNFYICQGSCMTFTASGATTYAWMPGFLTTATATFCPASPTTYTVIGTNGGGCSDTNVFTIYINPNPIVTAIAGQNPICNGTTTVLSASGASTYTWAPATGLSSMNGAQVTTAPVSSITYTVCGMDMNGCMACTTIAVNVSPSPYVTFTITPNATPHVWDVIPTVTGGNSPYTYSWDWGDGSGNSTQAYPSHTYTTPGWYNVCLTVTDVNGCTSSYCSNDSLYRTSSANSMITLNVMSGSTGMAANTSKEVTFYPNPAGNFITIENPAPGFLKIFDLSGKPALSKEIGKYEVIDISSLPEGLYFLQIRAEGATITRKLTISR